MQEHIIKYLCKQFDIDKQVIDFLIECEKEIESDLEQRTETLELNQFKVIAAMQNNRLSSTDFNTSSGYGYGDVGRDKVEAIYAEVFKSEDALVRPSIASGTHALSLTFSALLRPGDELIYITGAPYDTLQKVIGSVGNERGSLREYGICYKEIPLKNNQIDINASLESIGPCTKVVALQRSTGYGSRRAFTIEELEVAIKRVKNSFPNVIIMVDNCYGEFTEQKEPIEIGADVTVGSLIKNPGGGIALSGGYIVGSKNLIELIANRLTAPGLGKDVGLTFGTNRQTLQGLFLSPKVVSEAKKGSRLFALCYSRLGFEVIPSVNDPRSDIIQAVALLTPERVSEFCKGIQAAAAVDSYVTPEAWDMPGYENKVIMAAGGFVEGSSIELSADGPMRKPYYVYFQGGLTYEHCKLGALMSLNNLYKKGLIDLN